MGGRGTLGLGGLLRLALVLVMAGVLWGVGAAVAGYHLNRNAQDMTCGARVLKVAFIVGMYKTEPCGPGGATSVPSDIALPCTVYVAAHDALVAFTGPDSGTNCAAIVRSDPNNAGWTRNPQVAAASQSRVCSLTSPNGLDNAAVSDSGSEIYGIDACNQLTAEGWKAG
jgi:hypothetical protein